VRRGARSPPKRSKASSRRHLEEVGQVGPCVPEVERLKGHLLLPRVEVLLGLLELGGEKGSRRVVMVVVCCSVFSH
jgi:hypothetical protein